MTCFKLLPLELQEGESFRADIILNGKEITSADKSTKWAPYIFKHQVSDKMVDIEIKNIFILKLSQSTSVTTQML